MLTTSITGTAFAQVNQNKSNQVFDLDPKFASRKFIIDLGKGNKMQIELNNMDDLRRFENMDSVIRVFLKDIEPLKDSLGDELLARRIDYTMDSLGRSKIRIQRFSPTGSSYLINKGDVSAIKMEQDTINFLGSIKYTTRSTFIKAITATRSYRLTFLLNNLSDLSTYLDGSLNQKIETLRDEYRNHWNAGDKQNFYLTGEPSITAKRPHGFVAGGDYFNFRFSVDIQNYRNYFVPSFSLGAGVIISNTHFKRDIVVSWEPHFFFGTNNRGGFKTFRNDFLALTWGQGSIVDHEPTKESHFLFIMSLGYLVKRDGEFIDKNTFRLGGGRLSMFGGKTKVEPAMYFNNFFKGVTPALRLIQSF